MFWWWCITSHHTILTHFLSDIFLLFCRRATQLRGTANTALRFFGSIGKAAGRKIPGRRSASSRSGLPSFSEGVGDNGVDGPAAALQESDGAGGEVRKIISLSYAYVLS